MPELNDWEVYWFRRAYEKEFEEELTYEEAYRLTAGAKLTETGYLVWAGWEGGRALYGFRTK